MKWDCGPTREERNAAEKARIEQWHSFFCLWPRRVGPSDCRWLETIERRCICWRYREFAWVWEYRAK